MALDSNFEIRPNISFKYNTRFEIQDVASPPLHARINRSSTSTKEEKWENRCEWKLPTFKESHYFAVRRLVEFEDRARALLVGIEGGEIDKLSGWKMQNRYFCSSNPRPSRRTAIVFCFVRVHASLRDEFRQNSCSAHKFRHGAAVIERRTLKNYTLVSRESAFFALFCRGVAALSTRPSGSCTRSNLIGLKYSFLSRIFHVLLQEKEK